MAGCARTRRTVASSPRRRTSWPLTVAASPWSRLTSADIGANDVDGCVSAAGVDNACVAGGIAAAGTNLRVILGALQAADPGVRVVGMNYYDPFLAVWRQGTGRSS